MASEKSKLEALEEEYRKINKLPRLSKAVENVDKIIELLSAAREQVASASESHTAITITKLQNPVKTAFEAVNDGLKGAAAAHKKIGKALDRSFPLKPLPTDHDAMADHVSLINRAIAMHLLREGQFSVASTFISEVQSTLRREELADMDEHMDEGGDEDEAMDADDAFSTTSSENYDLSSFHSQELQENFAEMYNILQELKAKNLMPAITWARNNSVELEARGSNLEFELSRLQFVWLFKGPSVNGLPDDENNGQRGALRYARSNFAHFQVRHLSEINRLACSMAFAPNIAASPYKQIFAIDTAFSDVASSFTREFCSLLGLSAESPLYLAATAGALALPQLMKYTQKTLAKGTEWTTSNEMAFETPLPESMLYHSIFVCPVSKEQTTDANPPMMIPCGHVLAKETLQKLCKGSRFKCPYCPSEGMIKDARQIIL
ncbi:CTLH/CRA C-terminal to lish motif domain-containing protein [Triangularia verruculosa]|uniref:GID complex catalytic subunit 2 n=1 Tax=Triangularia verruculosa TaxID=2587418 RepID=A0AAN7B0K6_9PEZI|nr:CTLH/CRA C-terminal to lish motif domain-containing protein [Triangularia verruculosa]